jgi:N-acetylated-alpha-linked acidic dipeptidase
MITKFRAVFLLGLLWSVQTFAQEGTDNLRGFTSSHSAREHTIEKQFEAVPDPAKAEANHKILTSEPHVAGSPADRRNAEFVLQQFRSFGLDAEIEEFPVLLSEPKRLKFDLLEPVNFSGPNPEYVSEDPASNDSRNTPGFNAYSASGQVTAAVVYANYGQPQDYDVLRSKRISTTGKIVIVRYGECYRGVKALVAEEQKAAAVIIYSDPRDDGFHAGEVYPNGPWRPASGVQRGSVLYDFIYPGILEDHSNMPHIPVLPLSYEDARHILENLAGEVAPQTWQGGLPFTYHLGGEQAKVRLSVEMNEVKRPVWNVIAKIRGRENPEEVVVLGNHRDAWTYGGVDPNSGTTSMLETARGLGALLRDEWHPQRSIWLCSWDAEEPDELGSTHFAEANRNELIEKAVAYLNLDSAVAGDHFKARAVPSLKKFLKEVAADLPDPSGVSLLNHANQQLRKQLMLEVAPDHVPASGSAPKAINEQEIEIGDLGGGTDYVAFLNHLGIPSTDFAFDGDYGVYHSIFDNHMWMKKFGDPTFRYHVAAARFLGLEALRLADADVLPLDYETYGQEIEKHLTGIDDKLKLLGQSRQLDLGAVRKAAEELARTGKDLNARRDSFLSGEAKAGDLDMMNRALVNAEKAFLLPAGLPRRPWFKHSIFAPGFYNGYVPTPLPGVHESIDVGDPEQALAQLHALTDALNRATSSLKAVMSMGCENQCTCLESRRMM